MGAKILEAALEYAEAGYAVIPVKRSDKAPYTANGLSDATHNPATIRQWWGWWPEANVAIVCGKVSGYLFVIDVDIKPEKGKHGDEELLKWEAQHGDFPGTVKQRTGSGGQHQFFRHPDIGLYLNKVDALPGIDIRGEGAYVVVSPSVYEDGRTYEWENGVSILDAVEIADANESVIELLKLNPRGEKSNSTIQRREPINMKDVPEGKRNSTMYSAACGLRRYGFAYETALEALMRETSLWTSPLSQFEVRKILDSAYSHEPGEVTIYSVNGVTAEFNEKGEYIPKLPPSIPREKFINPPPLKPAVIEGFLRQGEAMLIAGSPKAGKSFLLSQLALAVASGTHWLGKHCRKTDVLYVDAELSEEIVCQRLHDIWRMDDTKIPVYPENIEVKSLKNESESYSISDVADDVQHNPGKWGLVIIDPLYMFTKGDQNDNTQMKTEMDQVKRIYATGASVIINHHTTKGMQNGKLSIDRASGAGVIGRFFDTIMSLNLLQPEPGDEARPERIEADMRSFKQHPPINMWFDGYHRLDTSGDLQFRPLLDPKKESNDKKVDDIVKKVNHCYACMKEAGTLDDGKFTVDDFMEIYSEQYGKALARTTARGHLDKAGYVKTFGEKTTMRGDKPFKTKVTFYSPDGSVTMTEE